MIYKRYGNRVVMPSGFEEKIATKQCPVCSQSNKRRFRCCSKECTAKFWLVCFWSQDMREKVFARDEHTCRNCGVGNKRFYEWKQRFDKWRVSQEALEISWKDITFHYRGYDHAYIELRNDPQPQVMKLQMDHINPVALGGSEYDYSNCQTLCIICHKEKTKHEAKLFAAARRKDLDGTQQSRLM